jgi:hypothetical protein
MLSNSSILNKFDNSISYFRKIKNRSAVKQLKENRDVYIQNTNNLINQTLQDNSKYFVLSDIGE